MRRRVLITCHHLQLMIDHYRPIFDEQGIDIEMPHSVQQLSEAELLNIIDGFDGVIAGDDEFTAKVLEKGKRLKVIAKWGIGVDSIDLEAASRLGIHVSNTPNVFGDEVADATIGYIILLARQLHKIDESVRGGGWLKVQGITLQGKTVGIIGFGNIGQSVARRAFAHGMDVVCCDVINISSNILISLKVKQVSLDELLKAADFITLCCTLTPANRHMISKEQFNIMKKGAYLINTARGPLVDENALVHALDSGILGGAALDVFEKEPLPQNSPLRKFKNCIFGTHNSSNTTEAVMRVNELAIKNLLEGLKEGR